MLDDAWAFHRDPEPVQSADRPAHAIPDVSITATRPKLAYYERIRSHVGRPPTSDPKGRNVSRVLGWSYEEDCLVMSMREHEPVVTFLDISNMIWRRFGQKKGPMACRARYERILKESEHALRMVKAQGEIRERRNLERVNPPPRDPYLPRPEGFATLTPVQKMNVASKARLDRIAKEEAKALDEALTTIAAAGLEPPPKRKGPKFQVPPLPRLSLDFADPSPPPKTTRASRHYRPTWTEGSD